MNAVSAHRLRRLGEPSRVLPQPQEFHGREVFDRVMPGGSHWAKQADGDQSGNGVGSKSQKDGRLFSIQPGGKQGSAQGVTGFWVHGGRFQEWIKLCRHLNPRKRRP